MGRILIVDAGPGTRALLALILRSEGHETSEAAGVRGAHQILASHAIDVVITSERLSDDEGLALLEAARRTDPAISIISLAASASPQLVADSKCDGSFDSPAKLLQPGIVRTMVGGACERTQLSRENAQLKARLARLEGRIARTQGSGGHSSLETGLTTTQRTAMTEAGSDGQALPESSATGAFNLAALMEGTEKNLILRELSASRGVQAEAARRMGLSRSALSYKLAKYGIRSKGRHPKVEKGSCTEGETDGTTGEFCQA